MDIEDTNKCKNCTNETCANARNKGEQKDVSMAMEEDEVEKPLAKEPTKGQLLNPKGTRMAWQSADEDFEDLLDDGAKDEMEIDFTAKGEEAKKPKKAEKPMAWEIEEAKAGPSKVNRGRGRGRGRRN